MIRMNWNGLIVTGTVASQHIECGARYRGIAYGAPWPVNAGTPDLTGHQRATIDAVEEAITGWDNDGSGFQIAIIADMRLLRAYVDICNATGTSIRVLLCATPRRSPLLSENEVTPLVRQSRLLGYDYGYSTADFSALYSDVNPPYSAEMRTFAEQLNEFGLLDDIEQFHKYVAVRERDVTNCLTVDTEEGVRVTPIEDSGDFVCFLLREMHSFPFR